MDPIKYIFEKPAIKYIFDIVFVVWKAIKG